MSYSKRVSEISFCKAFLFSILLMSFLRIVFFLFHIAFFEQIESVTIVKSFFVGTVYDSTVLATGMFLLYLIFLLGAIKIKNLSWIRFLITLYVFIVATLTCIDIPYFTIYDSRMNLLLIEQLDNIVPILETIYDKYPVFIIIPLWFVSFFVLYFMMKITIRPIGFLRSKFKSRWIIVFTFILLLLFSFAYTKHHLYRYKLLMFQGQLLNQFVINAPYSFFTSYNHIRKNRSKKSKIYNSYKSQYAVGNFKKLLKSNNEKFIPNVRGAMLRKVNYQPVINTETPNVVLMIMEGMSATNIKSLNPNGSGDQNSFFEKLAAKGLFFTNIYGHGTRTHHGFVSLLASFPSVLNRMLTRKAGTTPFYTIATLLKDRGYDTSFVYSYKAKFDDKDRFAMKGGVDNILDMGTYKKWKYKSRWGVGDEDVYDRANQLFKQKHSEKKPFFSITLTSVNHAPYSVPPYFLKENPEYLKNGKSGFYATYAYMDWALGKFFEQARKEEYFKNTIFIIIADHGESVDPKDKFIKRFHIPLLIYAPYLLSENKIIKTVGSQADVVPTLLGLIGYDGVIPFLGRNLLEKPNDDGFAFFRNRHMAFWRQGQNVLEWDLRSQSTNLYQVDKYSYRASDKVIDDSELKKIMVHNAKSYIQTVGKMFFEENVNLPKKYQGNNETRVKAE